MNRPNRWNQVHYLSIFLFTAAAGCAELADDALIVEAPLSELNATALCGGTLVTDAASLRAAIEASVAGDKISLAAGEYVLDAPLRPKSGTKLCGAGADQTIVTAAATWVPGTAGLPSQEDPDAFLFTMNGQSDVTIVNMTLSGPTVHGAVFAESSTNLRLSGLTIRQFLWSGVRTFRAEGLQIHDNVFINAGGRHGNTTGGAVYTHFVRSMEAFNNRILLDEGAISNVFGFKGRGGRNTRIHHNEILVSFAIEYPFDGNRNFEIDHNYIDGTISIPKQGGGPALSDGELAFHIHHNVILDSFALEFARNHVHINHNLFSFDPADDRGNLITNHGGVAPGPAVMHNNLIKNPGRGIFASGQGYSNFSFFRNQIDCKGSTRSEPLFKLNPNNIDFSTIEIRDNIVTCGSGNPRPLLNNVQDNNGVPLVLENNRLENISDTNTYDNPETGNPQGTQGSLTFRAGVNSEYRVNGFKIRK